MKFRAVFNCFEYSSYGVGASAFIMLSCKTFYQYFGNIFPKTTGYFPAQNSHLNNCDHHTKRDLLGIAQSIDPDQPAKADHGLNFSLLADFLTVK